MTKYVHVWDDELKGFDDIPLPEALDDGPAPIVPVWQDVSGDVMFGFNGLRHWPDLGVGGEFRAEACIQGRLVHLKLFGKIGAGATFPSDSAWYFYMLSPELMAADRAVGSLVLYNEGQGTLTGGNCRFLYKGDATPPYYPLCLFHSPLSGSAGYVTAKYPWDWKNRVGSWFLSQITYEAI